MDVVHLSPLNATQALFRMLIILSESRAIARYLATKHAGKGTSLMPDPTDLKAVALFEQWASVEVDQFDKPASPLIVEVFLKPYVRLRTVVFLVRLILLFIMGYPSIPPPDASSVSILPEV